MACYEIYAAWKEGDIELARLKQERIAKASQHIISDLGIPGLVCLGRDITVPELITEPKASVGLRTATHADAGIAKRADFGGSGAFASADNGAGMAHAASRRRGCARDESRDGRGAVALLLHARHARHAC